MAEDEEGELGALDARVLDHGAERDGGFRVGAGGGGGKLLHESGERGAFYARRDEGDGTEDGEVAIVVGGSVGGSGGSFLRFFLGFTFGCFFSLGNELVLVL